MSGSTKSTIVVIEDDPFLLDFYVSLLRDEADYDAIGVCDVESCLEVVRKADVDLILSDVKLEASKATDLLTRLRGADVDAEAGRGVKVVFVSGLPPAQLQELGIEHYLAKPFDINDFMSFIADALQGAH